MSCTLVRNSGPHLVQHYLPALALALLALLSLALPLSLATPRIGIQASAAVCIGCIVR